MILTKRNQEILEDDLFGSVEVLTVFVGDKVSTVRIGVALIAATQLIEGARVLVEQFHVVVAVLSSCLELRVEKH